MQADSAACIRLRWLRAHRLGQPMPRFKRWFAAAEYHVRYFIWKVRNV